MAQAYILYDGNVIRDKDNIFTSTTFFTTGHLAQFKIGNTSYMCATYLDSSIDKIIYVEEQSFYEHIDKNEYEKMNIYSNWEKAQEGDTIKMEKREIEVNGWNASYCWKPYTKSFHTGDKFSTQEISINGFNQISSGNRCNNNTLSSTALEYFLGNIFLSTSISIRKKIGNIAQLINNIDKNIYEAFNSNSEVDSLKQNQKTLWKTLNTSSLSESLREKYYNDYYTNLLNYYNEVKKRLYILNSSTNVKGAILMAMSMHPKVLEGLTVSTKVNMLYYIAKNILSDYIDKVEYEEFVVNLCYSFSENDTTNINLFLDKIIEDYYSISDSSQKKDPTNTEFEISRNSVTLFEALYKRLSQSWKFTEDSIPLINYISGSDFNPVLTRQNFADAIYRLWRFSKYNPYKDNVYNSQLISLVEDGQNTTFRYTKKPAIQYFLDTHYTIDKTAAPVIINYKSESELGMFYQNFIFEFTGSKQICALTNDWNTIKPTQTSPEPPVSKAWFPYGYYDIYQPVTLLDHKSDTSIPILTVDNKDASGDLENYNSIIPIFYIKHIAELNKRKNAEFLIFRAIDLISIFKLQGALATKLTHIRSLSNFEKVIVFSNTLQLIGTDVNFILSFISSCNNSEFCKKLKTLMAWLEFSQLATDSLSLLQKKISAKKFVKEIEDNGAPDNFKNNVAGQKFISHAEAIAEGTADLAVILEKLVNDTFDLIKPNLVQRIKKSTVFSKKYFNNEFTDERIKSIIRECINLDLENPKFIEDFIIMAARGGKKAAYTDVLVQINYYKKVILEKGFCSGFLSLNDYKLFSNKGRNFFEEIPIFRDKVIEYRVQGSVLKKRNISDPVDPNGVQYLEKINPSPPPPKIMDTPDDLDVDLVMSKSNAIVVTNNMRRYWKQKQFGLNRETDEFLIYQKEIDKIDKALQKGIVHKEIIFLNTPGDLYQPYRNAIKNNGQDLFKAVSSEGTVDIGFAIIIKGSDYDVLPTMSFKY